MARKVVIATRTFVPDANAAALRLNALAKAFQRHDWKTTVFTSQPRERVASTSEVRRVAVLRNRDGAIRGYLNYLSFDIPLFFRLLFSKKPDIYISEAPPTTGLVVMAVAFLKRRKYFYFAADVWHVASQGIKTNGFIVSLVRWAERLVWRRSAGILSVTPGISKQIIAAGIPEAKIHMIGSGVDTDIFNMSGPQADLKAPTFIYAGTMSEFQGAEVFVRALSQVSNIQAELIMFGQGTEQKQIEQLAETLVPNRVRFPGLVEPEVVAEHLRSAVSGLVSLKPDIGYGFVIPTKSLVSLACGAPIIYSGAGPIKQVIRENELGWAVDWEVDEVAQALEEALKSKRREAESARRSHWVQEHHSLSSVADRGVRAIAETLVSDHPQRG